MKVYFDTEFTGLRKDTTLISIGLVSDDGKCFYGVFTDYNKELCDDWINVHVIKNLYLDDKINIPHLITVKGSKNVIANHLKEWLESFNEDIELVSDVCHYDMALFIDIFGTAFDLPKYISPVCYDINQEIAHFYQISNKDAFDKSREDIVSKFRSHLIDGIFTWESKYYTYSKYLLDMIQICKDMNNKHNALYDALVIFVIYNYLNYNIDLTK